MSNDRPFARKKRWLLFLSLFVAPAAIELQQGEKRRWEKVNSHRVHFLGLGKRKKGEGSKLFMRAIVFFFPLFWDKAALYFFKVFSTQGVRTSQAETKPSKLRGAIWPLSLLLLFSHGAQYHATINFILPPLLLLPFPPSAHRI